MPGRPWPSEVGPPMLTPFLPTSQQESQHMLSQEEYVEASALKKRGWTIAAIARHLGVSRNTVKAYLRGQREPGHRERTDPDLFAPFAEYLGIRLRDDPHVWGSALYDEARKLGYEQSYVTFARQVRLRGLRPVCDRCRSRSRATIEIEHEAGEEIQWDWVELPAPWGDTLHLLQGRLPFSGRTRGVFAESEEEAHLVEAIDGVLRRLGGTARKWRIDRMSTAYDNKNGRVRPAFAAVARYYGAQVVPCPPYRAKRKGSVEKDNDFSAQRWFRTAMVGSDEQAQISYDHFCVETGDRRERHGSTIAELARQEHLLPIPSIPYPATIEVERQVGDSSLVYWRGNRYSVNPGLEGSRVHVRHRVGTMHLEIATPAGLLLASHFRHPDGAGTVVRLPDHETALENVVLANFTSARPCARKVNRPPSVEALAAAARLRDDADREVVVDLARYSELAGAAR